VKNEKSWAEACCNTNARIPADKKASFFILIFFVGF
jgi:hypothetical protein